MRKLLLGLLLALPLAAVADLRLESMLEQGLGDYEMEHYNSALAHFTAALTHSTLNQESPMYPAAYLCAIWYFGKGVPRDLERARTACSLVQGNKSRFQVELFQRVLDSNSQAEAMFTYRQGMADAAAALAWYLGLSS